MRSGWPLKDRISILMYGASATGKTTTWGSFPGPIGVAICSGGKNPGELLSLDTPEMRAKVEPYIIEESNQMKWFIEEQQDTSRFGTLVLDHVSGLQDLTLKEILGLSELPAQKSWGLAKQEQWGQSSQMCKDILRGLLNLTCNIVIIGQERIDEPKEHTDILTPNVGVATTPSVAGWLNPAVDYIGQTFKRPRMIKQVNKVAKENVVTWTRGEGVEYCLRVGAHDIFTTKFRVPKRKDPIPDVIVDPTYDKIIALLKQSN